MTTGRDVAVWGTGGMAREAAAWVQHAADDGAETRLLGFLDDDETRTGQQVASLPVLGGFDWLASHPSVAVVPAMGRPAARSRLDDRLRARGFHLASVVHPTAVVGPRTRLGDGVIVAPQVVLTADVEVGRCAILNYGCAVGHDGVIGAYAFVGPGAHLAGNVSLGAQTEIGIGASIIQGLTVGEGAVVGAGAVVIRSLPDGVTAVGVPARVIRRSSAAMAGS